VQFILKSDGAWTTPGTCNGEPPRGEAAGTRLRAPGKRITGRLSAKALSRGRDDAIRAESLSCWSRPTVFCSHQR
jgi:hypothetical protein